MQTSTKYPDATLKLHVTDTDGNVIETIWDMIEDETWETFDYRQKVLSLEEYVGQNNKMAWQYVGSSGESV